MRSNRTRSLALAASVAIAVLTACSEEGPAERTGKAIDDAVKDMGDNIEGALDDTKDAIEDGIDDMKKATRDAMGS